ncbi:MAG: RluA family pseudouridine synthase [Chitinophagales bacterium]
MKPISILFEDDYYIAVDKPSGVLSIPPRAGLEEDIFSFFKAKYDDLRLVHRIDKETSGVLIFAKGEEAQRSLSLLFEHHTIFKEDKAILAGIPKEDSGTIENYLDEHPNVKGTYRLAYQGKGKLAISHYQIEEKFKRNCLVAFQIETGRTHQIRVHAQFLGCPLGYDPIYNPQNGIFLSRLIKNYKGKDEERSIIQRLSLHAQTLRFYHPFTGEVVDIQSLFPRDFQKAIEILRKHC